MRALRITSGWLISTAVLGAVAYLGLHHYSIRIVASDTRPVVVQAASPVPAKNTVVVAAPKTIEQAPRPEREAVNHVRTAVTAAAGAGPVMVSLTAHARTWIKLDADGKTVFMGTLTADETKEISANEQIKLQTGNAGALSVSLNGKAIDSLGGDGQFRELRLTAEGPEFLQKDPRPQHSSDQL